MREREKFVLTRVNVCNVRNAVVLSCYSLENLGYLIFYFKLLTAIVLLAITEILIKLN